MALPSYDELVAEELPSYESLTQEEALPSYEELTAPQMPPDVMDEALKATGAANTAFEMFKLPYQADWSAVNEQKRAEALLAQQRAQQELAAIERKEGEAGGAALSYIGENGQPVILKDETLRRLAQADADVARYTATPPSIPTYEQFAAAGGTQADYEKKYGRLENYGDFAKGEVAAGRMQAPGFFETALSRMFSSIEGGGAEVLRTVAPGMGTEQLAEGLQSRASETAFWSSLDKSTKGDVARGVGAFAGLMAGNPAGKPGMVVGALRGAADTYTQVISQGGSKGEAETAAAKTFPMMLGFLAGSAAAAKFGGSLVGQEATALQRGLAGGGIGTAANIGMSAGISAIEGTPYTAENFTMDALFGVMGGMQAAKAKTAETLRELSPEEARIVATRGLDAIEAPATPTAPETLRQAEAESITTETTTKEAVPSNDSIAGEAGGASARELPTQPLDASQIPPEIAARRATEANLQKYTWNGQDIGPETQIAFRLPDGRVVTDPSARIHAQAGANIGVPYGVKLEPGFIIRDEFVPGSQTNPQSIKAAKARIEKRKSALEKEIDSPLLKPDPLPEIQPAEPRLRPLGPSETGGIFARGKRTPPVKPIGTPPSGSPKYLEIKPFYKRPGFEREGASPILRNRQENPIGHALGRATDKQFDAQAELEGKLWKEMDSAVRGMNPRQQDAAFKELEAFTREKENGRPTLPLSADAQKIQNAWENIAEFTGLLAQARGVQVSAKGGYRPMRLIGRSYVPRMYSPDFLRAIRDPKKYGAEFNAYVGELSTAMNIPPNEAAAMLSDMAGGKGSLGANDFMGNIEIARGEKLPESFYDYDMRRVISNYITRYSSRMGQIIAYGQRLEGPAGPVKKNLWDLARDEVRGGDTTTGRWLNEAEAQSTGERSLSAAGVLGQRLQTLATGLLLSNPVSTVPRNLIGGMATTSELLGTRRTIKSAAKAITDAQSRLNAKEAGVVRESMASLLHVEQLPEDAAIRRFADTLLSASGYNASEQWVRTTNFLAADSFAKEAAELMSRAPNSRKARQMASQIERTGVKPDDIIAENGDWQTGDQTRRFIRAIVNQQQGGYKFNQVPLWAGSPTGRFFYQFGRWGSQRADNLWKNVFKPAFVGSDSTIGGVKMRVRDFKPLVRMGLGTVLVGEAYALLPQLLLDKDRKDASLTEIATAITEDQKRGAEKMMGRAMNDIIMSGMMGIWGQPVDFAVALKDQSRLKNPAEPPGGATLRASAELLKDLVQQGTLTGDDLKRFAQSFIPGAVAVTDVGRNIFGDDKFEAENDQRTLRNAGLRFAQDTKMDVKVKGGGDGSGKTDTTPVFAAIRDALIVGDAAKAKELAAKSGLRPQSISTSVRNRQPFRVGPFTKESVKQDFYRWAEKNLSKGDLDQVRRVQARYEQTARAAGLW